MRLVRRAFITLTCTCHSSQSLNHLTRANTLSTLRSRFSETIGIEIATISNSDLGFFRFEGTSGAQRRRVHEQGRYA